MTLGQRFTKGHGTQNDFVILDDPYVRLDLAPGYVAALCDRQRGIGADGVLRVASAGALVSAKVLPELPEGVDADDFFMDYRNGDGSIAEMCGNGVRVFAHYLRAAGLVTGDEFVVGSRAGGRAVVVHHVDRAYADVSVAMGAVRVAERPGTAVQGQRRYTGDVVDVGNPHLACVGVTPDELAALDLRAPFDLDPAVFPHGANLEFVTVTGDGTATMRVQERGVGETRSCGTGVVAAAAAVLRSQGRDEGRIRMTVPGGVVDATIAEGSATLRGPSILVGSGVLNPGWNQP